MSITISIIKENVCFGYKFTKTTSNPQVDTLIIINIALNEFITLDMLPVGYHV